MKYKRIVGLMNMTEKGEVVMQLENGIYAAVPVDDDEDIAMWGTVVEAHSPGPYGGRFIMCDEDSVPADMMRAVKNRLRREPETDDYRRFAERREQTKNAKFMEEGRNWVTDEDAYIELAKKEDADALENY